MNNKYKNEKFNNMLVDLDNDEFNLVENEDIFIPRVPRPILWLRHIDRINKISAAGEVQAYINSVNQFEALIPEKDEKYQTALKVEQDDKNKHSEKLGPDNIEKKTQLELDYHLQKFRILIELLKRKNMY